MSEKSGDGESDQEVDRGDYEYSVISAPVRRKDSDIQPKKKPSSAYKMSNQMGKMSIDSLSELTQSYDEESSTKTHPSGNKDASEAEEATYGKPQRKVQTKPSKIHTNGKAVPDGN